jgi:hypothetical protein
MRIIIIIVLVVAFIACEDDEEYNCPSNLTLPEHTNSGVNEISLELDSEVWVGVESYESGGAFSRTSPSFYFDQLPLRDENGRMVKDKNGIILLDTIYELRFESHFKYDCKEFFGTSISFRAVASVNSSTFYNVKYKEPYIVYSTTNGDSYRLNFDKPHKLLLDIDKARNQASCTFSGIFTDYDSGDEKEITNGFFDMIEIGG